MEWLLQDVPSVSVLQRGGPSTRSKEKETTMSNRLKRVEKKVDLLVDDMKHRQRVEHLRLSAEWDALGRSIKSSRAYQRGSSLTKEQRDFWRGLS